MAQPRQTVSQVIAELRAVADEARRMKANQADNPNVQTVVKEVLAAPDDLAAIDWGAGARTTPRQAVAAVLQQLRTADDEAARIERNQTGNPRALAVVRALRAAERDLAAIDWPAPPPPARLSIAKGFATATPLPTRPVQAEVALARSGDVSAEARVDYAVSGAVQPGDFVGGKLPAGTVLFPKGAPSATVPVAFAPQALAAPRKGRFALAHPVGAELGDAAAFDFTLLPADQPPPDVWRGLKTRSGLGWLSGYCTGNDPLAYLSIPEVETLRRRRLDVFNVFGFAHSSWDDLVASATKFGWAPPNNGPQLGQEGIWAILTIPTIVNGANYKDAAAGAYNGFHQQCAQAIKGWGLPSPIILRLGREPNDKGQPFSYFNDPSPGYQNYKDAHRHIVDVYAGILGRQNIVFSWCVMKRAEDWENAYPGDDFTDVVDVDIYLNTPHVLSQQDWDQQFLPIVQPHIDFAAAHGKYFASSEWGVTVSGPNGDPANDSAVWMQNMWELWNRLHQRKMMAWECYYGPIGGSHDLTFQGNAPQASAAYARAWSGG